MSEPEGWWVIVRDGGSFSRKWFATEAEARQAAKEIERQLDGEAVRCGVSSVDVFEVGKP